MNKLNQSIFGAMFLSATLLANGMYSANQIFAQHENVASLNESEIDADIEQDNKCKKETECENKNKINNTLNITTITGAGAGGNGNGNGEDECSNCFLLQNEGGPWQQNQLSDFEDYIAQNPIQYGDTQLSTIDELCAFLNEQTEPVDFQPIADALIAGVNGYQSVIDQFEQCLEDAGLVFWNPV